ncbi:PIN domain nuclease [Sphingobium amiense]|uniref:PIN domain nuclease n=1 Tax=Sphingobium amiense TaxID=135719 RepID=A0A494W1W4_9SPHN|nr:type II toxin-antitoxin system VapC family toxin [Sphingobium amiense]BBD98633.1 PIN domain nuclease [Sphingobium amiense]
MNLLLDSHVLIWWWANDRTRLGKAIRHITAPSGDIFVSAATAWEIATKHRLGKLQPGVAMDAFADAVEAEGFLPLDVKLGHALRAGRYALTHGDPFDRLLAAQAELEGLTLLTRDPVFAAFPCTTLWD